MMSGYHVNMKINLPNRCLFVMVVYGCSACRYSLYSSGIPCSSAPSVISFRYRADACAYSGSGRESRPPGLGGGVPGGETGEKRVCALKGVVVGCRGTSAAEGGRAWHSTRMSW